MFNQRYKKYSGIVLIVLTILFILIQFLPSSFSRTNPPVTGGPKWDSPETQQTFSRLCADCHSNETQFPWYSAIAPASWFVESDVAAGRKHFNVSTWDKSEQGGDDAADQVNKGAMPIGSYLMMHPGANLNVKEKKQFVEGLQKTFGSSSTSDDDKEESK